MDKVICSQGAGSTLEEVKKKLLSLGKSLLEAEALGIFGSLARGYDFSEKSDIDVFVVVKEAKPGVETDLLWWRRISDALEGLNRDVTVLVYDLKGLKGICNWYVLRLASEGVLFFDKGNVKELFEKIKKAAEEAGMVQEMFEGRLIWKFKDIKLGEEREVKVN